MFVETQSGGDATKILSKNNTAGLVRLQYSPGKFMFKSRIIIIIISLLSENFKARSFLIF